VIKNLENMFFTVQMKVPEKARDKTQAHRQVKESASNSQPHWDHLFLFNAD